MLVDLFCVDRRNYTVITEQCLSGINHTIKGEGELLTSKLILQDYNVYASENMLLFLYLCFVNIFSEVFFLLQIITLQCYIDYVCTRSDSLTSRVEKSMIKI